jgi:hypothetical protein
MYLENPFRPAHYPFHRRCVRGACRTSGRSVSIDTPGRDLCSVFKVLNCALIFSDRSRAFGGVARSASVVCCGDRCDLTPLVNLSIYHALNSSDTKEVVVVELLGCVRSVEQLVRANGGGVVELRGRETVMRMVCTTRYADKSEQSWLTKPTLIALSSSSLDATSLSAVRRASAQCGDSHHTAASLTTAWLYTEMDSCVLGKVASP